MDGRSPPIPVRESPAEAGLNRVYGQWDNYRTNFDDFIDVYLLGIQLNIELVLGATFLFFEYTVSCRVESDIVP